jgi:hypothetical protein
MTIDKLATKLGTTETALRAGTTIGDARVRVVEGALCVIAGDGEELARIVGGRVERVIYAGPAGLGGRIALIAAW